MEKSYRLCLCIMNDIAFLCNIFNLIAYNCFNFSNGYCQGKSKCTSACSVAAIMTVTNVKMEK